MDNQNQFFLEPLANRLRPQNLSDYVGQKHLVGKGKILYAGHRRVCKAAWPVL